MQRKASYKATPFTRKPTLKIARTVTLNKARSFSAYSKKAPTGEIKFLDTINSFTFDTTGEVPATGQLNLIPQGTGEQERIGRKVHLKSIHMRGTISPNPATWSGGSMLRLLLVQDKQCNGAAATYSGVNGVLENDVISQFRNLENIDRFIIHKDWYIPLNAKAGVSGAWAPVVKEIEFHKKLDIPIEFDSTVTTGALTSIRSNNLFLLARSTVDDDIVTYAGVCRVRFVDG